MYVRVFSLNYRGFENINKIGPVDFLLALCSHKNQHIFLGSGNSETDPPDSR